MSDLPSEAVTAAAKVLHDENCVDGDTRTCGRWNSKVPAGCDPQKHIGYYEDRSREVLEAAAPHIAAAERERILRLARQHGAVVPADEGSRARWASFADLVTVLDAAP